VIREPIVVVGGHVDHGKTSFLDYIRGTAIADREAGKITQHIGATEVPIDIIKKISLSLLEKYKFNLKIPGLLFIDTPGHEAFSSLRERGARIADIAVLVIDVMQGCQPQTFEMINFLKENKTPFIVALTKIDLIKGFRKDLNLTEILKEVDEGETLFAQEFTKKFYNIIGQLGEKGFNADRFDKVTEFTKELLLIPISSKTNTGIAELLLFLSGLSQKYLESKLEINKEGSGKAVVLEVKETKGFGKTIDIILFDGIISKNDYIKIESRNGVFVSKIKMILKPRALSEIREKHTQFKQIDSIHAASGLKIVASNVGSIVSGDIISVISKKEADNLETKIKKVKSLKELGILVKTDTEGSAEAIDSLANKEEVEIFRVDIGKITKEDVIEAKLFAQNDFKYGAIFAFNSVVPSDIEEYAKQQDIKIFSSNVIYKIFEEYKKWVEEKENEIKENILKNIIYPVKFKILPQYIFRVSKPLVCGVEVIDGVLKPNIRLIHKGKFLGILKKVQDNGKDIKEAKKGMQVAVSIEGLTSDKIDFDKEFYSFIPLVQRKYVYKYLKEDYNDLIDELSDIYIKLE